MTVGDYNNDGFDDLFITYWGQNVLYRNNGDGTFTDVTEAAGLLHPEGARWGSGCTFVDYDRDGHLDLFVGQLSGVRSQPNRRSRATTPIAIGKAFRCFAGRAACQPVAPMLVSQQRRWHVHRC